MRRVDRVKVELGSIGLNRSMLIRRLIRLGHPRLRELRARAIAGEDLGGRMLRPAVRWIESGLLRVLYGHGAGLAFEMRYLPISHAHLGLFASGNLETAVQEAMIRHLGEGGVFYDIGANLGFFSLIGGRMAGMAHGHVYAFEPAPDNAEAIRRNAALNGVHNITVIDKAVSSHGGRGRLQIVDDQSWSKLEEYGQHPYTERVIDVELVAIDELLAAGVLRPPTVVKLDVEGAEIAALEGMRATIREHRPAIICELHGTHQEFASLMAEHGYRVINLEGTLPVQDAGASAHALALPPLDDGD